MSRLRTIYSSQPRKLARINELLEIVFRENIGARRLKRKI
jgi:hypothetical protein